MRVPHNIPPKHGALDLAGAIHEVSKVVGNPLGADETIHILDNGTGTGRAARVFAVEVVLSVLEQE